jgi:hypothetical protein
MVRFWKNWIRIQSVKFYYEPCLASIIIFPSAFMKFIFFFIFRDVDSFESVREMDSMAERGEQFYKESGELFKLAGVLRAADILWNPEKRQFFFYINCFENRIVVRTM